MIKELEASRTRALMRTQTERKESRNESNSVFTISLAKCLKA